MPRISVTPPRPRGIVIGMTPLPPVVPSEECPECPPAGICEIIGLYWYAPGMSGDFEEAQSTYAEMSGSDPDYEWTARHVFNETAPEDIWVQEIGFCDTQPWSVLAVLRGWCEAMGEIEWVATWTNTDDNPGWTPYVILAPGAAVVGFTGGADSGVEDGAVFALSAIVDGVEYGPITFSTKDCG